MKPVIVFLKTCFKFCLKIALALNVDLILNRNKLIVLMYHGVTDKNTPRGSVQNYDGKHVFVEKFEKQIRMLSKRYTPISLDNLNVWLLNGKKLPRNPILFTFDDGYKNNHDVVYPILNKYNIPAIIFICPHLVTKINWPDSIENLLTQTNKNHVSLTLRGKNLQFDLTTDAKKIKSIIKIKKEPSIIPSEERNKKIEDMIKITKIKQNFVHGHSLMCWDEIKELSRNNIAIQSHSLTHPIMSMENVSILEKEFADSKKIIEQKLNNKVTAFAYPNGAFNDTVKELARKTGYLFAFSTKQGKNNKKTDLFEIRRIPVTNNQDNYLLFTNLFFNFNKILFKTRKLIK